MITKPIRILVFVALTYKHLFVITLSGEFGQKHYEIGVVAVMVLHIREPSLGDISRTSHSDERYIANHYALPLRQA